MRTLCVRDVMTQHPYSIAMSATVEEGLRLMRQHRIRHLAVTDQQRLVGLVSLDDLHLAESLEPYDPAAARVEEAMIQPALALDAAAPLAEMIRRMLEARRDAALITDASGVCGIFTTTDALRVLAEQINRTEPSASIPDY